MSTQLSIGAHVDQTDPVAEAVARETSLVQFFLGDPQGYKGPEVRYAGGAGALRAHADAALRLLRRLPRPAPAGPPVPDRLGPPPHPRRTSWPRLPADVDWIGWAAVLGLMGVVVGCLCVLLGWST